MYNYQMFDIEVFIGKTTFSKVLYGNFFSKAMTELFDTTPHKTKDIEKFCMKRIDWDDSDGNW